MEIEEKAFETSGHCLLGHYFWVPKSAPYKRPARLPLASNFKSVLPIVPTTSSSPIAKLTADSKTLSCHPMAHFKLPRSPLWVPQREEADIRVKHMPGVLHA